MSAGLALTVLGAVAALPAVAAPVTTQVAPGSFSLLDLGTGSPDSRQPIVSSLIINSGGITTITFSGGGASGDPNQASGVYAGNQARIAFSPLGPGDSTTNYLTAQSDPDLAANVRINYAGPLTTLDFLWGTVDGSDGYNLITTSAGETITGGDVLTVVGGASGATNVWLRITELSPFTWIEATDSNGNPSAFEFLVGVGVPEPASFALLGGALVGFGIMWRRRCKMG